MQTGFARSNHNEIAGSTRSLEFDEIDGNQNAQAECADQAQDIITINTFAFDAPWSNVDWIACDANLADWIAPAHSGNHFTASGWNPPAVIPAIPGRIHGACCTNRADRGSVTRSSTAT